MNPDTSFADLIAPIKKRMFETVWRVLRHAQDSEDALQNALTSIWRQRAKIESHCAPESLILKICADAAIDQFRRRRRDKRSVAQFAECLPSAGPPAIDDAIDRERLEIVMEAISRLSANQASAVVMRFFQGESDASIAAALGCGPETVREHLHRGRERLGHILGRLAPRGSTSASSSNSPLHQENER